MKPGLLAPLAARTAQRLRALYDGLWLLPIIRRIPTRWRKWAGLALIALAHFSHEGLWVVPFVPLTLELKVGLGCFSISWERWRGGWVC